MAGENGAAGIAASDLRFGQDGTDVRQFFPGGKVKSNFLLNIGYGDPSKLRPRVFRFEFDEVCSVL